MSNGSMGKVGRELMAAVVWLYVLTKLFIFDFDVYFVQRHAPSLQWVLDFKFLFLFGFCAFGWLFAGTKTALLWCAHVLGYPFILLFWRFPRLVARQKSWTLVIALLNGITSGVRSARQTLPEIAAYHILLAYCIFGSGGKVLVVSAMLLLLLMVYSCIRRCVVILREPQFYRYHVKVFTFLRERGATVFLPGPSFAQVSRKKLDKTQKEKWRDSLQMAVLFNRIALFWARRLRDYQRSGVVLLAHAFSVVLIAFFSVFCFAAINYAVFKWEPTQFRSEAGISFFNFVYYSFNNMVFNSVTDAAAAGSLSKALVMAQYASDFAFLTIFVSMFIAHRGQRHVEELQTAIEGLESESKQMAGLIKSNYNMSIEGAIAELQRLQASLAKVLLYLAAQCGEEKS